MGSFKLKIHQNLFSTTADSGRVLTTLPRPPRPSTPFLSPQHFRHLDLAAFSTSFLNNPHSWHENLAALIYCNLNSLHSPLLNSLWYCTGPSFYSRFYGTKKSKFSYLSGKYRKLRKIHVQRPPTICSLHAKLEIHAFYRSWEIVLTKVSRCQIPHSYKLCWGLRRNHFTKSGHCKRYRATGPHRVTGPESTAWLRPLTGTVGGDVSANNSASNVIAWPCEMCGVRGWELGELNVWKGCKLWNKPILTSKHIYEADLWASLKC